MLEQAMSSTKPTAPSSTSMGWRVSPAMKSVNGSRNMPQAESRAYSPLPAPLLTRSLSTDTKALAEANGTAGLSLATAWKLSLKRLFSEYWLSARPSGAQRSTSTGQRNSAPITPIMR